MSKHNNSDLHSSEINKALIFSAKAHQEQLRKGTDIPYIIHPYAVGMILARCGCEDYVIIAGILHDVVEDGWIYEGAKKVRRVVIGDIDDPVNGFGKEVADIVAGCSEPGKAPDEKEKPWQERKQHTIDHLKSATREVKLVACADKLHNVNSMLDDYKQVGNKLWDRFNEGREKQKGYFNGLVESLESTELGEHELVREFKQSVALLFDGE
jgi:(p)ppGpp synthase/HD superfamily hydrolase